MLTSGRNDLRDLAESQPELVDAGSGRSTGLALQRFIGAGGMASVFAAELRAGAGFEGLAARTPRHVAVKLLHPDVQQQVSRLGGGDLLRREAAALERLMRRNPACEFIVDYFGGGSTDISVLGVETRVPWIALELVQGGRVGVTLEERVECAVDGIDPVRALRLLSGLFEAVQTLHDEEIIHRDLKPENVLVVGAVDEETPKLADCGIARVDGVEGTVAALTPAYAGPEQAFSLATERNVLVGPWTDVHALAAVVFFVLGGETWCRGDGDTGWHRGRRRSLMTAAKLHAGFVAEGEDWLNQIDAALRAAGSPRLPQEALDRAAGTPYEAIALKSATLSGGEPRIASARAFSDALLPVLHACATAWSARAAQYGKPVTALRTTQMAPSESESRSHRVGWKVKGSAAQPCPSGCVVVQPDGRVLARFGDELLYFIDDRPMKVKVPSEHRQAVASAGWIVRGPGSGFAIVGEAGVLLLKKGAFALAPPNVAPEGAAGEIQAVLPDGRPFGVICADTQDIFGAPTLWTMEDHGHWHPPRPLPMSGDARASAAGPFGLVVAGARGGKRACAMFASFDGQNIVYAQGIHNRSALTAAVCGSSREAWVAGEGFVLALERGEVRDEPIDSSVLPIAMGLDPEGVPWLLTDRSVYRRHLLRFEPPRWVCVHTRSSEEDPFVALGFVGGNIKVVDALGGHITLMQS